MRSKHWSTRVLSLLLALQMLCAPLAQATPALSDPSAPAEDLTQTVVPTTPAPTETSAEAVVPTAPPPTEAPPVETAIPTTPPPPEETTEADNAEKEPPLADFLQAEPATAALYAPVKKVELVFGFHPFASSKKDNSQPYSPLAVESTWDSTLNGRGGGKLLPGTEATGTLENVTFGTVRFSDIEDLLKNSRVPDREFVGWYLYPKTLKEQTSLRVDTTYDRSDLTELTKGTPLADIDPLQRWETDPDYPNQSVTVIARWGLSRNANARASVEDSTKAYAEVKTGLKPVKNGAVSAGALKLYPANPGMEFGTVATADLPAPMSFDPAVTEYYLRVPADVAQVSLDMLAAEPFHFWKDTPTENYGVTVKTTFDRVERTYSLASQKLNVAEVKPEDTQFVPVNTVAASACSLWTTNADNYISLEPSQGSGKYYNEVAVTITAPDGVTQKTYTFYIQRLNQPRLEQKPGNTPYGMIEGDTLLTQAEKTAAKTQFDSTRTLPGNLTVEGSRYYKGTFWGPGGAALPFDQDENGLAVYLNNTFKEPGVVLYNSAGDPEPNESHVSKAIQISTVDRLTAGHMLQTPTTKTETLSPNDNGLWTVGATVLPDVYTLEYTCVDAITGVIYTSGSSFVDSTYAKTFSRSVAILPLPGDVDMSGAVTPSDGIALQDVSGSLLQNLTTGQALYTYRVCDVADTLGKPVPDGGPNGLLNPKDVSALYNGFVPSWHDSNWCSLFYTPLEGVVLPQRASKEGTGTGSMTLEYLGKGDTPQSDPVATKSQELKKGDCFWVGIHAEGWAGPVGYRGIRAVSVTLVYDSKYLTPAVETGGAWVALPSETDVTDWQSTMMKYNLGRGATWPENMTWLNGSPADKFSDYDTKAETTLANTGTLREMKLSLQQSGENGVPINAEGQWLIQVPFLLKEQPVSSDTLKGIDLSLGSGSFAGLLAPPNEAGAAPRSVAWDMAGRLPDEFNLAQQYNYQRDTLTSATTLYLAPDGREHINLGTITYGDSKEVKGSFGQMSIEDASKLPPGMTYEPTENKIFGTPTDTGTFRFVIGGKAYRIDVEPAPLDIWPEDQAKYYGEANPTLTFRYDVNQIKAIDRPGGVNNSGGTFANTGSGTELEQLSGHKTLGTLTTRVADGETEVGKTTPAGPHQILLQGWENNHYSFVSKDSEKVTTSTDDKCSQAVLEIKQRPFLVKKILSYPVETVRVDTNQMVFEGKTAASDGDVKGGFTPALPQVTDGMFQGLPLTGDPVLSGEVVNVRYTATFTADLGATGGNKFLLVNPREDRDVTIGDVTLVADDISKNYKLFGPYPTQGKGSVMDRNVAKVEFVDPYPDNGLSSMTYTSGDAISLNGLTVKLTYEALSGETAKTITVKYQGPESFAQYGLNAVLLADRTENPKTAQTLTSEEIADYSLHHGKHFGIWLETGLGDETKVISTASQDTLTIKKRLITIIPDQAFCFYGEDPNTPENGGSIGFRYSTPSLTDADLALAGKNRADLLGTSQELLDILNSIGGEYHPPTTEILHGVPDPKSGEKRVEAGAAAMEYYFAIMSGASAKNYSFQYTQYDSLENMKDAYGSRYYAIKPRPIVVDQVTMSTSSDTSKYFLFDDTKSTRLETMYGTADGDLKPTASGVKTAAQKDSFTAKLPQVNWGGNTVPGYYPTGGSVEPILLKPDRLTGDALFGSDKVDVTYVATYTPDTTITNGNPNFQLPDGDASGLRTVEVSNLALVGEQAQNYVLVYTLNSNAGDRFPEQKTVADTGLVKLRPIRAMEVSADPTNMSYTYGQTLDMTGMKLKLTYETAGDNTKTYNPVQTIPYRRIPLGEKPNITFTDTFAQLGMLLKWEQRDGDVAGYAPFQSAKFGDYPTVADHNGRQLVAYGRRHTDHVSLESQTAKPIVVKKAPLNLTVTGQTRYYGEPNGSYGFTFDPAQLSQPDQIALGAQTPSGTADSQTGILLTSGPALSTALTSLTHGKNGQYYQGYNGPIFTTEAARSKGIGTYDLALSGGTMDNYFFTYTGDIITVEKRPIALSAITGTGTESAPGTPIYNIYFNAEGTQYTTAVDSNGTPGFTAKKPVANLPRSWSGDALYQQDALRLRVKVNFPSVSERGNRPATTKPCNVTITEVALAAGGSNDNYVLQNDLISWPATGQLDARNIVGVEVVTLPSTKYLYGQGMNLSAMKVRLSYEGTGIDPDEVYAERDDRVKVYYYDSAIAPGSVNGLQECKPNDHLTIAPQPFGTAPSFSHQNKYLVVQATQSAELPPTTPILVTDPDQGNRPVQIKITPLDLTYHLTAESKVYDGTTSTNGTVTVTNKYAGDDVTANAQFDFLDANVHYRGDGYTTQPGAAYWTDFQADPVRDADTWHQDRDVAAMPVLLSNVTLTGAQKDNYTIANSETDLNSKKAGADDPGRGPVQTSGKIGLTDNAVGGTRGKVPFATISRADRPALAVRPQVSVDDHTNVVRVDYEETTHLEAALTTSTNANGGEADAYRDEAHLEYLLEGLTHEDQAMTWAGADGTATTQDTRFFGGEAVTPAAPVPVEGQGGSAFIPNVEDFPTQEELAEEDFVFQGQRYRWNAEDPGFVQDKDAYPGGVDYVRPGYDLYTTDRTPLPRAALLWAGVRMAATHNYNASPMTWSVEGDDKDQRALAAQPIADQVTQQRLEELKKYGEEGAWAEEEHSFVPGIHGAVNSYTQRLDMTSVEEQESQAPGGTGGAGASFTVYTLESVWFTDLLEYPKKEYMDGAADNDDPVRYHGYYWDELMSAELEFEGKDGAGPLSLATSLQVTVKEKVGETEQETTKTVNENNTAAIFVNTKGGGGGTLEEFIEIAPSYLVGYLGDDPVKLTAKFYPSYADLQTVVWTSSDPEIASIHREKGLVTFKSVGACTITARSINGRVATATVVVKDPILKPVDEGARIGNFQVSYAGAYLSTDGEGRFDPERPMTRGELAQLLSKFCVQDEETTTTDIAFDDLEGTDYAQAVTILAKKGIVQGSDEGFQGERLATRAELAAMLARMLCLELPQRESGFHAFADAGPQQTWAWAHIDALAAQGIVQGVGEGLFVPNREVTNAEVAVLLDRVTQRATPTGEGVILPLDVPQDYWAYESIVRGLNSPPPIEAESPAR